MPPPIIYDPTFCLQGTIISCFVIGKWISDSVYVFCPAQMQNVPF